MMAFLRTKFLEFMAKLASLFGSDVDGVDDVDLDDDDLGPPAPLASTAVAPAPAFVDPAPTVLAPAPEATPAEVPAADAPVDAPKAE